MWFYVFQFKRQVEKQCCMKSYLYFVAVSIRWSLFHSFLKKTCCLLTFVQVLKNFPYLYTSFAVIPHDLVFNLTSISELQKVSNYNTNIANNRKQCNSRSQCIAVQLIWECLCCLRFNYLILLSFSETICDLVDLRSGEFYKLDIAVFSKCTKTW